MLVPFTLPNAGECDRWGVFCKRDSRGRRALLTHKDAVSGRIMRGEFESRSGGHCEDLDYSIIIKFQFVARLIALGLLQGE